MSLPLRLPRLALNKSASRSTRLHPYLALAARYWAFVVGATLVGALAAYGLSQLVTPSYEAKSTLYFSIGYGTSGSDLNQGATYAQGQMLSFAELAQSERVLQPVIDDLELDLTVNELARQLEVTTPANTVVLDITANSTDPALAASITNRVAQSLTGAVIDVAPRDADGKATVSVRTVESADPPTVPTAPNTRVNVVAGALIGLVLSLLVIAALRLLDTRVRTGGDVAAAGGLPVLARLGAGSGDSFATDPSSALAEDYRRLVATLDAVQPSPASNDAEQTPRTTARRARVFVLATVAADSDRDEAVAVVVGRNLALAAAEAGHRVALISGPATAEDTANADDDIVAASITTRPLPLGGKLAATLLNSHDLVLIAAPGSADGSRALRLAQSADGIVLLATEGRVHIGELREVIELLHTAGAQVAGTVLTSSAPTRTSTVPSEERGIAHAGSPALGSSVLNRLSVRRDVSASNTAQQATGQELPGVLEQNKA